MKLSEFILLNKEEKKWAVLNKGILIAKRRTDANFFFLFRIESFYVELCCDLTQKEVVEFIIYAHEKCQEPYLENINLSDLLE